MGVKFKGPLGKKNAVIIALVVILLILIGGTGAAIPFILSKKKQNQFLRMTKKRIYLEIVSKKRIIKIF